MKSTLKRLTAGAFAIALCAPFAIAEPGDAAGDKPKGERPARGERGADRPGGPRGERPDFSKLTEEEAVAKIIARAKENERFAKMLDKDASGEVSTDEAKAFLKRVKEGGPRGPRGGADRPGPGKGPRGGGDAPRGRGGKRGPAAEL